MTISNGRLESLADDQVTFRYKDYADNNRQKTTTIPAVKFLGRLLLHALPHRFMRIRYYGIWANRNRGELLPLCRRLIEAQTDDPTLDECREQRFGSPEFPTQDESETLAAIIAALPEIPCPNCGHRSLTVVVHLRAACIVHD